MSNYFYTYFCLTNLAPIIENYVFIIKQYICIFFLSLNYPKCGLILCIQTKTLRHLRLITSISKKTKIISVKKIVMKKRAK